MAGSLHDISRQELPNLGQAVAAGGSAAAKRAAEPAPLRPRNQEILVACGNASALRLEFAQLEGRNRVTAQEFVNGAHLAAGERFGA